MSPAPLSQIVVGVVVERRKADSPWVDFLWRPVGILPDAPDMAAWSVLREEDDTFHHIRKLAVFGSVLHGDARPDSDLDVLVEFEPGHVPGLAFFGMEQELSELLGRKVDLNTPQFLSPYFRDEVLA